MSSQTLRQSELIISLMLQDAAGVGQYCQYSVSALLLLYEE